MTPSIWKLAVTRVWISLALCALLGAASPAQAGPDTPRAVVELFTSQGCSSCPPADKLAGRMATNPDLVVLTWPVDIWDYLGWKDTLARPEFTARQRAYAEARADRAVYTPQVIVNGLDHAVGSDAGVINGTLAVHEGRNGRLPVKVELVTNGDVMTVKLPDRAMAEFNGTKATVWLIPTKRAITVPIGRGENGGATITYSNVVRGVQSLGMWKGAAMAIDFPRSELERTDADSCVVLVQMHLSGKPARIIGAGVLPMAGT